MLKISTKNDFELSFFMFFILLVYFQIWDKNNIFFNTEIFSTASSPNVLGLGEVAATEHFPAGDKLAIPHIFSSGGSAAILPICSLCDVAANHFSFLFTVCTCFKSYSIAWLFKFLFICNIFFKQIKNCIKFHIIFIKFCISFAHKIV